MFNFFNFEKNKKNKKNEQKSIRNVEKGENETILLIFKHCVGLMRTSFPLVKRDDLVHFTSYVRK